MGRGNWMPSSPTEIEPRYCYIELLPIQDGGEINEEIAMAYYDLMNYEMKTMLPRSFKIREGGMAPRLPWDRDNSCWFYNGTLAVVADSQGDYYHQGIGVVAYETYSYPGIVEHNLNKVADRLFWRLSQNYNLYQRTSAWTLDKFVPEKPKGPRKRIQKAQFFVITP